MSDAVDRECKRLRQYLLAECSSDPYLLALWFVDPLHRVPGQPREEEPQLSFEHIEACQLCERWFYDTVPPEALKRQARMLRYCCSSMFASVEEWERRQVNRFEFSIYPTGDVCWSIDGKPTFASYCPWCSTRLPDKPFISSPDWPNSSFKPTPHRGAA